MRDMRHFRVSLQHPTVTCKSPHCQWQHWQFARCSDVTGPYPGIGVKLGSSITAGGTVTKLPSLSGFDGPRFSSLRLVPSGGLGQAKQPEGARTGRLRAAASECQSRGPTVQVACSRRPSRPAGGRSPAAGLAGGVGVRSIRFTASHPGREDRHMDIRQLPGGRRAFAQGANLSDVNQGPSPTHTGTTKTVTTST